MEKSTARDRTLDFYRGAFAVAAAGLAGRCGVRIEFGDGCPCTDGKTIRLNPPAAMGYAESRRALGTLLHECGHVRFTDMSVGKDCTAYGWSLFNALEDVRIERRMADEYLGGRMLLDASAEAPLANAREGFARMPAQEFFPVALECCAQVAAGRRIFEAAWRQARPRLDSLLGRTDADALSSLVAGAGLAADSLSLLEGIVRPALEILRRHAGPAAGGRGKKPDAAERPSGEDSRSRPTGGAGSHAPEGGASGAPKGAFSLDESRGVDNPLDNAARLASIPTEDYGFERLDLAHADFFGERSGLEGLDAGEFAERAERGERRLSEARAAASGLAAALERLLQDRVRRRVRLSDSGVRIKPSELSRLATGSARIFLKKGDSQGVSAAVHVLLDASGSMCGEPIERALGASLALCLALGTCRSCNPALTVFQSRIGSEAPWTRTVVRHGEGFLGRECLARVGSIRAGGGTPTGLALKTAGAQLLRCPQATRRILLVTDGDLSKVTAATVRWLRDCGIRVYPILVGDAGAFADDARDRFGSAALVKDAAALRRELFALAAKAIA